MSALRLVVIILPLLLFVASPALLHAQGLVPVVCESPELCGTCEFVQLINNVIDFLVTFAIITATLVIIYAGFQLVTSGGDMSAKQQAKELITNVLIGIVLVLTGFLIINTILGVLLPGDSRVLGWQQIECLYPTLPVEREYDEYITSGVVGGGTSGPRPQNRGVCQLGNLQDYFGSQASVAQCVAFGESTCGANLDSTTDFISTGQPFSFGTFQINATVHPIEGCQGSGAAVDYLDCPAAFSGSNYGARIINQTLYDQCRTALYNEECSLRNAARLQERDGWGIWSAYTNNACG